MVMTAPADISPAIVETLYSEALVLADEARAAFNMSGRLQAIAEDEDLACVALSSESLRITTRMMHATAWLINQRAFLAGEMSELQLRRYGRLPPPQQPSDPHSLAFLDQERRDLVAETERFYARLERLDRDWHSRFELQPAAIHHLRDQLDLAVGAQ